MESIARLFVLALFGVIVLQLAAGGWPAVGKWFRAKFIGTSWAAMPAFGFMLLLLGIWLVIRTVKGGLVDKILNL